MGRFLRDFDFTSLARKNNWMKPIKGISKYFDTK